LRSHLFSTLVGIELMKFRSALSPALFGLLVVVAFAGCGSSSNPATYPVTGTVTFEGKPLAGANVGFSATDENTRGAIGVTDSEGKYSLTTFEQGDGAMAGTFKVTVSKFDGPETAVQLADPSADTGGEMPADYSPEASTAPARPSKNLLPQQYLRPQTTPLSFTVETGPNTFDIVVE